MTEMIGGAGSSNPIRTRAETPPKPAHVRMKSEWRAYSARVADGKVTPNIHIGLSGSFTVNGLVPMLGGALLDAGLSPQIKVGEYNQIFQTCFEHSTQFKEVPDVIALLWRIEDMMAPEFARFIKGERGALDGARRRIEELVRAVGHLRKSFQGTIIFSIPPFPEEATVDRLDLDTPINAGLFHRAVVSQLVETIGEAGQVRLIDIDALQRSFGAQTAFDARNWYLYKQPYTEAFLCELGQQIGRIIRASKIAPKKCVVLDCDNTLWGGIVGEDGLEGIAIGDDFPGSAFRDLQKWLLHLGSQGVLLAISSKNNEVDVFEVFDNHDGMVIKRDHLSASRVNWDVKSTNIKAIADELNIGVESLVFIDDNPFEVGQVGSSLPGLTAIQLHDDPAQMLEMLKRLRLFDKLEVTEEDLQRAEMMKAEKQRAAVSIGNESKETFVASLGLKVELGEATQSQLGRVTQLINKTNQFNLSTIRRTLDEVEALSRNPDWSVYALRVSDKFGEYGLVGVALVEKAVERWRIDTFLMSCRVLGRDVETVFLATIGDDARAAGASAIEAEFVPSAKNELAAQFLPKHGFASTDGRKYDLSLDAKLNRPAYVELIRDPVGAGLTDSLTAIPTPDVEKTLPGVAGSVVAA